MGGIEFDNKNIITGISSKLNNSTPDEESFWRAEFERWSEEDAAHPNPPPRDILEDFLDRLKLMLQFRGFVEDASKKTVTFKK